MTRRFVVEDGVSRSPKEIAPGRDRIGAFGVKACSDVDLWVSLGMSPEKARSLAESPTYDSDVLRGIGDGAPWTRFIAARELVSRSMLRKVSRGASMSAPSTVRDFLTLKLAGETVEKFVVMFLDSQHRLLAVETMFTGTLAQTSVYPREVVKAALRHNAAAVIFAHNHPSGVCEPSRADELLTSALKNALALVDVRALDHFIVAGPNVTSFAEKGLI